MIDHESYQTQGLRDRFQPLTIEEIQAENAKKKAWEAEQMASAQAAQAARDSILDPIRARLAAGTVNISRLQIVTGLDAHQVKSLLEGGSISQYGWGETEQALAELAAWAKDSERPTEDVDAYAVTPTFNKLQNLFAGAHQNRDLIAITGSWGIGKTKAAQYYAASHPRTYSRAGAVRIQFDRTDCKPVAALEKIRDGMGANPGSHRRGNAMNAVGAALRPGDFLILEECQRLGEALDVICSLHDDFDIGIAMIGNPDLITAVWGNKSTFGALASRANRFDFPCTAPEDVEAWLAWHGLPDGLDSNERKQLSNTCVAIACAPTQSGGLRALADVTRMAQSYYPDQRLTGPLFMQLASQLKPRFTPSKGREK